MAFEVSFDEVQCYDWQSVPAPLQDRDRNHDRAFECFYKKAADLEVTGDVVGVRVFRFLGAVASLSPSFESKEHPFSPLWKEATRRSAALDDFTGVDALVLARLVPVTIDTELKARFADVSSVLKFDHDLVREASIAYLATARLRLREKCDNLHLFVGDLERAAQLGFKLGRKRQPFLEVMQYAESLVANPATVDIGVFSSRVLELLQDFDYGNAVELAQVSELLAERVEGSNNPHFARAYWRLAREWYRRAKQEDESKRCAIRAAETHVLEAGGLSNSPTFGYMAAASHLTQAVNALRNANAPRERIDEVHKALLETQKHVHDEMGPVGVPADVGKLQAETAERQEEARKSVEGSIFHDGVFLLTHSIPLVDKKQLRDLIIRSSADSPLVAFFPASKVDAEGRVVGIKPSMLTNDPVQYEAAVMSEMLRCAATYYWPDYVQSLISPRRLQIWREHRPRIRDLSFLVADHPFVPPGHEYSYARGLHAGFEGDWHAAAYFLTSQVENSIRYVLGKRDVITSKLNDKLIQEVRSLDQLLDMPETIDAFGENHVFALRGVLTEEFGYNLRNRLAHGLLTDGECYAAATEYLWWLLLRLCVIPLVPDTALESEISSCEQT